MFWKTSLKDRVLFGAVAVVKALLQLQPNIYFVCALSKNLQAASFGNMQTSAFISAKLLISQNVYYWVTF